MGRAVLTFGVEGDLLHSVRELGLEVLGDLTTPEALAAVRGRRVAAVVHAMEDPVADATTARLRAEPGLDDVANIALVPRGHFAAVERAYVGGADDVAGFEEGADIARRIVALVEGIPAPPATRSPAVVADPHDARRTAIGRLLRRAGFDVRFVLAASELRDAVAAAAEKGGDAGCVVADAPLALDLVRGGAPRPGVWVLCADPDDVRPIVAQLGAQHGNAPRIGVHDRGKAMENILFHVNELANASVGDLRASPRVLWAAPVRYRLAGRDEGGWAMAFNVNRGGIYLRTLGSLPVGSEVWLEMQPVGSARRVHMEARVVWRKPFGSKSRPLAPPGMGLLFTGATPADQALFNVGYETLLSEQTAAATAA